MIPGQQAAIIAHMASHVVNHHAHFAVQASFHHFRNAAVLELADRLVGHLSEELAHFLGLNIPATQVLISAETQKHVIARRAVVSQIDSELVASRIAEAFANVRYWRLPQRDLRVFELLGHVSPANRLLLLALKHIPAESASTGKDELWIRTAHPFGKERFTKEQKKGCLRSVHANPTF